MGASYSNITLHGPERDRIIQALEARGRQAYVGPATGGVVVVFDEQSDDDPDVGAELARELTGELKGVALVATVHDDDIFLYSLVRDGQVVDEYNSAPGYFDGGDAPPEGGDAALLASVFGAGNQAAVERVLRHPAKSGDYMYETARHADLFEVLGLPEHAVGAGFGYIYQGDEEDLEPELARVGFGDDEAEGPGAQMDLLQRRITRVPGGAEMMAQMEAAAEKLRGPAHGYFPALLAGDAAAVRALFEGEPVLDDPVSGRVEGAAAVDAHVAAAHARFAGGRVSYMGTGLAESPERVIAHGQLTGQVAGDVVMLPCACVWERGPGGGFRELRAYWSPAGLKAQRGERAPILPPQPGLPLPEPVGTHLAALAADDLPGVLGTYDPTCLAPVPVPWLDPEDTVRRQYGAQVGEQGAVVLTPCVVTEAEATCAVEFVTTKWDGADVPAQAGLAIYELRGGKVCQVHVFGDLAPSPAAGLGALGAMGGGMGMGGMGGFDMGAMGAMGGMPGLGGMGGLAGGMPGLEGMQLSPEQMQEAMDEAMRLLSSGNMGDIMKNLQQMMGGMQGMPGGLNGFGIEGVPGTPGMEALFANFGGMDAAGWDDEEDDGADAAAADGEEPGAAVADTDTDGDAEPSGGDESSGGGKPA